MQESQYRAIIKLLLSNINAIVHVHTITVIGYAHAQSVIFYVHAPPTLYLLRYPRSLCSRRFRDGVEKLEAVSLHLSEHDLRNTESSSIVRESSTHQWIVEEYSK